MSDVRNPKIKVKGISVSVNSSQDDKFKTTFLKIYCRDFRKISDSSDDTWKRKINEKYPQETEKNKYEVVIQGQHELIAF